MSISDRLDETTEQSARVIGSVMSRWDMDGRPDVDGGIDTLIARALAEAGLLHDPLPTPGDGCQCTGHSQDYGGYVEYLMEYEPSCPEHSEHVWNPRTGMWEHAVDRSEDDGRVDQ